MAQSMLNRPDHHEDVLTVDALILLLMAIKAMSPACS